MKKLTTILFILLFNVSLFSQFDSPKNELRGVWIAALGIDWPSVQGTSVSAIQNQKSQLLNIFDFHKNQGLNAIFLHMRPICDALYKSNYEPWSSYLTGTQGAAPSDTSYDPLKFAIEEAHLRGMELHAWLNPYRAELQNGSQVSSNHIINKHPEWIIKCNGSEYRFLNPGLPKVREYVVKIVMDIVRRYNVDGIHFDDYFYPYSEYGSFNDDQTFNLYPNGFTDKAAWRKNNVNLLLKMINDSIKVAKPWVKFGVSPSGNPSVNSSIYCDPAAWLKGNYTDSTGTSVTGEPYIDYIMPQLYWSDYGGYISTWSKSSFLNGRHLYIGQAAYRYGTNDMPANEPSWEVMTNRSNSNVKGGVYFSSRSLTNNLGYGSDTLRYRYFTHPAITPKMKWVESGLKKPNAPMNLSFEINSSTLKNELHWDKPTTTTEGDTAFAYVVYRSDNNPPDVNDSTNIFGITGNMFLSSNDSRYSVTKGKYYAVTAIDRYSNESSISNVVSLDSPSLIPDKPVLISPSNDNQELGLSTNLVWSNTQNAERYIVQVAEDSTFSSDIILLAGEFRNNKIAFRNIIPGDEYYWRVKAFGQVGENESEIFHFQSGVPIPPILDSPPHATYNVSLTPKFSWHQTELAASYRFQLSKAVIFQTSSIIYDQTVTDTMFLITNSLDANKKYFWRVSAVNSYGASFWSDQFGFQTTPVTDVETEKIPSEFSLSQNYPNPFNPSTEIRFSIPKSAKVELIIYDILGKEVVRLLNSDFSAGSYSTKWNGRNDSGNLVPSGMYIYKIKVDQYINSKKMILMK